MSLQEYLENNKKYIGIVIYYNDLTYQDHIINLFKNSLNQCYYENNIFLSSENVDLNSLILAINEDFGKSIEVFKTPYVNNYQDIVMMKKIFETASLNKRTYTTFKDLLIDSLENNDILFLKNFILNKLKKDDKILEVINGMFINDLNICKTAKYVYMHRNTINNKLEFLKKELELDIQKFIDAMVLYQLLKK